MFNLATNATIACNLHAFFACTYGHMICDKQNISEHAPLLNIVIKHVFHFISRYIPVLMQQAKIYWDMENYQQVEKIFRKSVEFCNEHDIWKLNVAHVLFMQENKYKEATGFYEPIVKKNYDNVRNNCKALL